MKIARPPFTTNTEDNLSKQHRVFDLCYDPDQDMEIPAPLDCPLLDLVHSPALLRRAFNDHMTGFGEPDRRKVQHAEASASSFLAAVSIAVKGAPADNKRITFAPVSGAHHAGWDFSGGYCTFNHLMVGAMAALGHGWADRVLILDGDGHYGNGTEDLINHFKLDRQIEQWHIGRDASPWWHEQLINEARDWDLILYQAGADAHINDPYGVGSLTTNQFRQRDQIVFGAAKNANVPIVWNLAGGYNGNTTLDLHAQTFQTACEIYYPTIRRKVKRAKDQTWTTDPTAVEPGPEFEGSGE